MLAEAKERRRLKNNSSGRGGKRPKPRKGAAAASSGLPMLDADVLAAITAALSSQEQFGVDADAISCLQTLLDILQSAEPDSDDVEEALGRLGFALTQVAIDDRGGDAAARTKRAAFERRLEGAIASPSLDAASLVLLAKVLRDAGWSVPETLKAKVVDAMDRDLPNAAGSQFGDLNAALEEIVDAAEGDAFAAYDAFDAVLSAFPATIAGELLSTVGHLDAPVLRQALAGFVLHREPNLAASAIAALAQIGGTVESALVERLVRMRPWLPAERQSTLDPALRSLRARTLAPVESGRARDVKALVLTCDGAGANGAAAATKFADGWRFASVLARCGRGIDEAVNLAELKKAEAEALLREMGETAPAAKVDAAEVSRFLELALGENVASRTPPPFRLIALAEDLGLGPIAPLTWEPGELFDEWLAADAATLSDDTASTKRLGGPIGDALARSWFEAGEHVEHLLRPLRGRQAREKAMLERHLPERRAFWARQCAMTAFVMRLDPKTFGNAWRLLAIIGRQIAGGAPLANIALMRQIAAASVEVYEENA